MIGMIQFIASWKLSGALTIFIMMAVSVMARHQKPINIPKPLDFVRA